jgi:FKBP-type peptidyl-prolyl cis-trans isomerase SlyD
MIIERDRVVRFHYTLSELDGEKLESSADGESMVMLYGHGGVIPGVEQALAGHSAGDRFSVTVPPEQAYGRRIEGRVRRVPKKLVPNAKRIKAGDRTVLNSNQGQYDVTVVKVGRTVVDVDSNHPLAGLSLVFDIEVLEVREAQAEEITHGHVHGPGGHGH